MEKLFMKLSNTDIKENYVNQIIEHLNLSNLDENIYILDKPLIIPTNYDYQESALIVLIPNHKISFINLGDDNESFEDYCDYIIEDISKISWRHNFEEIIGRRKKWENEVFQKFYNITDFLNTSISDLYFDNKKKRRLVNIILSFFIGSINEAKRIKSLDIPENIIELIKRRIILLDTDQVRFIFEEPPENMKQVIIQGLSGTGKTELLFHKLKELYLSPTNYRLLLTCHNRVLAAELKSRIVDFFNIMQVPKQIDDKYLKIVHAWGSKNDPYSGAYRYITHFYNIPFYVFSTYKFDKACQLAIEDIKKIKEESEDFEYLFDYVFIDESQDFPQSFFNLCELVTKEKVYIAGDVFQDIFEYRSKNTIEPYLVLNKCYRTDNKNLMFSHALAMGLFERPHLRWFDEDKEWEVLGYKLEKNNDKVKLYREPLKRFPDIDEEIESIFVYDNEDLLGKTISIIKSIREEFEINPSDIAIILLDNENYIYELINEISYRLFIDLDWQSNNAVETKSRKENTVFITNRNNVKGLEFPFVICLTKEIKSDLSYRNTLYSMLSRSLIRSYLVVESGVKDDIKRGLNIIKERGYIETYEPNEEEKKIINENLIKYNTQRKTFDEILEEVFREENITDLRKKEKLKAMILSGPGATFDKNLLREFIKTNNKFIT